MRRDTSLMVRPPPTRSSCAIRSNRASEMPNEPMMRLCMIDSMWLEQ